MPYPVFEKETLLDISVNLIPLAIIALFVLLGIFFDPWYPSTVVKVIFFGLHLVPFVSLAIVTYVAARHIG